MSWTQSKAWIREGRSQSAELVIELTNVGIFSCLVLMGPRSCAVEWFKSCSKQAVMVYTISAARLMSCGIMNQTSSQWKPVEGFIQSVGSSDEIIVSLKERGDKRGTSPNDMTLLSPWPELLSDLSELRGEPAGSEVRVYPSCWSNT